VVPRKLVVVTLELPVISQVIVLVLLPSGSR